MFINCKNNFELKTEEYKRFRIQYSESIEYIQDIWLATCPNDEYWQAKYHMALESSLPNGLKPYYCILWQEDNCVGLVYMQHKVVNLNESIRLKKDNLLNKILKKTILPFLSADTLVIGNMLLTGKYGFHFDEKIDVLTQFDLLDHVSESACMHLKEKKINIATVLLKDFFEHQVYPGPQYNSYVKFSIQPNMIFTYSDEWKNMNDYVQAMKTKARTRHNRSRKKIGQLKKIELQIHDLDQLKDEMHALYMNIVNNVNFNLFFLNRDYFYCLKKELGEDFKVYGYYDGDQLIAFYTLLKNYNHIDAHFLGYDYQINKEHQIYHNMLIDMVEIGFEQKANFINMSRTAVEIKSSVGAEPNKMYCYLKHRNSLLNHFVKPVVGFLYKDEAWVLRNPFKEEN